MREGGPSPYPVVFMEDFDLLSAVQPSEGWFAVFGIKGKQRKQHLVATRAEVDTLAAELVADRRNVFFGVAKYATAENRTKENVKALRAFWLDIDCGEDKAAPNPKTGRPDGYEDQAAGIQALRKFCQTIGLPKPILVNSGRGIHVYWALDRDVTREEWEPVAARLRELCIKHDFYIDPSVFEVARILRIPGTYNFKDETPALVQVMNSAPPVSFEEFRDILGVKQVSSAPPPKRELSELGKLFQENMETNFSKIMRRSRKGHGCAQLWACYEERAELSEPRWFDALSIAKFCVDREDAIHKMSADHPDYDPDGAEQKTKHILGPHTCDVFERNNPGGCDGCVFKGKIKSPIVLGRTLAEATEEDNIVEAQPEGEDEPEVYKIPTYPFPYVRGKAGGIYKQLSSEEREKMEAQGEVAQDSYLVFEYDLYVVKRMSDPVNGSVLLFRLHQPHDGVKEFTIPLTKAVEPTEAKRELAKQDVVCIGNRFKLLHEYILLSMKQVQANRRAEQMRLQFGWADNNSKFILGEQEITVDGVFHSPPSTVTEEIVRRIGPVGSFEKWQQVFNLYGRPGLEPHAFAALTAFGAPLLKFLGQKGAIINVIHPSSGTGKTTILHMTNSVWGSPDGLCGLQDDTLNAKILRLGVFNNLPYVVDEITNMEANDFSNLIYNITQGRGKDRVKASANELRKNLTTWQTIALCSSNASFYDKLSSIKKSPDGEMMRLLEYKIDYQNAIDTEYAKQMFDHQLLNNYGHAGLVYAKWLVANLEEAKAAVLSTQLKIDRELKLSQRERFWSALLAANITGGLIAKQIGLIDWDMRSIYKWALQMVLDTRKDVKPVAANALEVIGEYINTHIQNVLVVNDNVDYRSGLGEAPTVLPKGELLIRYEPDTKKLFLAAKPFKKDCVKNQVSYKEILAELKQKEILLDADTKRISKGMQVSSTGVHCLILDGEALKLNEILPEKTDAGGGS